VTPAEALIVAVHFLTTVAFTFLATVRWVRLGDDDPQQGAEPEPQRPSWARP
jgi:hypothetical protein